MSEILDNYDFVCKSCNHVNTHDEDCTVESINFERQLASARREGWEQGKKEAAGLVSELYGFALIDKITGERVKLAKDVLLDAIANMEYGGQND